MEYAGRNELILLAVLAGIAALVALAPILRVPYPILLVLGGLVLGFIPGIPEVKLPPEVVLVGVLPPLLYAAAFFTGIRDLKANVKEISLLAVGLVVATMGGVAVVAHAVTSLDWASSFVLGAIVSPTDPVAATAIASRLGIPRRIVTIVEGESLVNDATALVLYGSAVTAVVAGTFSLAHASLAFVASIVGGVLIGLAVGWLVALVRIRLNNIPAEIAIALLTGYLAYIPATALHVSGVLAAVTVGVYMGWRAPELSTPQMRMEGRAVFDPGLPPERAAVHPRRAPAPADSRRAERIVCVGAPHRRGGGHPHRDRGPNCLGVRRRPRAAFVPCGHLVDGHARRRLAGGRARLAAVERRRRTVPRARPDHLPRLCGHPRHPRSRGPLAAGADRAPRPRGRRAGGEGRHEGADPRRGRGDPAARRARRRGLGAGGHRGADARALQLPPLPLRRPLRRRRRRRHRAALDGLPAPPPRALGGGARRDRLAAPAGPDQRRRDEG